MRSLLLFICFLSGAGAFAQINTPAGAIIPFGSNTSYEYGIMPTNLPTGSYGGSTDAANAYNSWKSTYVASCSGNQYRVMFDDPNHSVSEGIAYGMILAAYAADKALFDGLWSYYKANVNGNGLMHWRINGCSGVVSANAATDAELDAALALLVAETQWPTSSSPYDYQAEAASLIGKIRAFEMDPNNYQASNGDAWGFDSDCRNPSYQSPAYYKLFANVSGQDATFWGTNAVNAAYTLIQNNAHSTTGLVSDWCNKAGQPNTCQSNSQLHYGYDACRNPWRMATEVIWFNDSRAASLCDKIAAYVSSRGAGSVGGPVPQAGGTGTHNATFVSTFAAGIMGAGSSYQSLLNSMYTETNNTVDGGSVYFGNTLRVISMFMLTGNFWKPGTSLTPEINVRRGTTNIPSGNSTDLGNTVQGTSSQYTFSIQNLGAQTLNISGITISGTDSSKFIIGSSPGSVSPNSSANFSIIFTAESGITGTFTATININNNDNTGSENPYQVIVTATATETETAPEIEVKHKGTAISTNSSAYDLGHITQSARGYYTFMIANTGDGPLNINNIALSGTGFSPYGSNPSTIPAGDSASFTISILAGSTSGTMTGSITIGNNDGDEATYVLNLSATVSACATTLENSKVLQDYEANINVVYEVRNGFPSLPMGSWHTNATNPDPDAVNSSLIVASLTRAEADGEWDQIRYLPCGSSTFNVTEIPGISIEIFSPMAGVPIRLSFKNADETPINADYSSDIEVMSTKSGEWEVLFFDLSALTTVTANPQVAIMDIMIDPILAAMTESGNTEMIYFIDDIRFTTPPCPPAPTISAGGATTFCSGQSVLLTASSITTGITYTWYRDGSPITGATSASYPVTETGDYSVTASGRGCAMRSEAITVTVNSTPEKPIILASGSTTTCEFESLTLTGNSTTAGVTYEWHIDGNLINGATTNELTPVQSGSYTITAISGSCSSTSEPTEVVINESPGTPEVTITGETSFCEGESTMLAASPISPDLTYQWNINGAPVTDATNATYSATEAGTYTVTASLNTCSSTSEAIDLVVNPAPEKPVITSDGDLSFCEGQNTTLTASSSTEGVTYQWYRGGVIIEGETIASIIPSVSGSYTVTVSLQACASNSDAVEVTISSGQGTPTITADGSLSFCEEESVTLTGNSSSENVTYQWERNGTVIDGATSTELSVTVAGEYTFKTISASCSATSTPATVTVNPSPSVPAVAADGDLVFCEGETVTLSATTSLANVSYQWYNNATVLTEETSAALVVTVSGKYTVTITSTENCSSTSDTVEVTVNTQPDAPTIAVEGETTICEGEVVPFVASSDFFEVEYQWYKDGVLISEGNNNTLNAAESGFYSVGISIGDCSSQSDAIEVIVKPSPVLSHSPSSEICEGETVELTASASGGTEPITYQWSPAETLSSATSTTTTASPVTTTTYSIVATNQEACSRQGNITITVIAGGEAAVSIEASPAEEICNQIPVIFTATPVNGGTPSYKWLLNGNSVGDNSSSFSSDAIADGDQVQCIMTSGISCVTGSPATSNLITMVVHDRPVLTLSPAALTEICKGESSNLTASISGGTEPYNYVWSPAEGLSFTTDGTVIASPQASTTYSLVATDANGCSTGTGEVTIEVHEVPVVTASVDQPDICSGSSSTLSAEATGGTPAYDFEWSPATSLSASAGSSVTASPDSTTTYSVVARDSKGCASEERTVTVSVTTGETADISIQAFPSESVCKGTPVAFTATPVNSGASPVYEWLVNGEPTGTNSPDYTSDSLPDGAQVLCRMTSDIECVQGSPAESNIIIMDINEIPVLTITATEEEICNGRSTILSAELTGGAEPFSYTWSPSESLSSASDANPTASPAETTSYSLVAVDNNGCVSNSATTTVNVNPNPSVKISPASGEVCEGSSIELTAEASGGTGRYSYRWTPAVRLSSTDDASATATPEELSTYSVYVTDEKNCTSNTATTTVNVNTPPQASVTIAANPGPVCSGMWVTFVASPVEGGDNPSYQWKVNGANVGTNSPNYTASLLAGYSVTCVITSSLQCISGSPATSNSLSVTPMGTSPCKSPDVQIIDGEATVDAGETQTYTANPPADGSTYGWLVPEGSTIFSASEDSSSITITFGHASGNVVLKETNSFGTTPSNLAVTVVTAAGTKNQLVAENILVHPNPSSKVFNIQINNEYTGQFALRVRNALGETVLTEHGWKQSNKDGFTVDLINLAAGIYFLEIETPEGTALKRLAKQ